MRQKWLFLMFLLDRSTCTTNVYFLTCTNLHTLQIACCPTVYFTASLQNAEVIHSNLKVFQFFFKYSFMLRISFCDGMFVCRRLLGLRPMMTFCPSVSFTKPSG